MIITKEKLELAKKLLGDKKEDLKSFSDDMINASNNYIGEKLNEYLRQTQRIINNFEIEVEALRMFIEEIESQIKQMRDQEIVEEIEIQELKYGEQREPESDMTGATEGDR